jgi:hypothetical protein
MRFLLALILLAPAFAQTPPPPKPDEKAAEAPAKAEAKPDAKPAEEAAAPAPEQWLTGSIDLGWRFRTDILGSRDSYRSIVNLPEGPRVFGVDFTLEDPKHRLFDRLSARGANWGDPYNTAHVDAVKRGVYDFRFDYRNILYFNALPSFANPLAPNGVNERSFDVHRRNTSFDLTLRPGKRIVPYLSYDHASGYGSGVSTWAPDFTNEYAVPTRYRDQTDNYRGGVRFEFERFHVTLEQGGTTFKDDDSAYDAVPTTGDRTSSLLGQTLQLNSLQQAYGIRAHSVYTKALFTANPVSWLDVTGQFLFSQPKTDVNYVDVARGNFALLSSLLFYSGQVDMAGGAANKPHISANVGFELRPFRRFRMVQSWMTDRYHDAAYSTLTNYLLLSATSTSPVSSAFLPDRQVVNYNQNQTDLFFDLTSKITLRAGYRYVWGDSTVRSAPLDPNGLFESGKLNRQVALAGFNARPFQKLSLNAEFEGASTTHAYYRTSLYNYSKLRARARYQVAAALSVQTNFTLLDNQNPNPGLKYDFRSRDNAFSVNWTPNGGKLISLLAQYDRATLRSDISYLSLPFLAPDFSAYRDNAHIATSAIDITIPVLADCFMPKLTAGGSLVITNGTRPSRYYEPLAKLSLPFGKNFAWNTSWQWYGFNESQYLYEGFRTHVFQTGFRLTK